MPLGSRVIEHTPSKFHQVSDIQQVHRTTRTNANARLHPFVDGIIKAQLPVERKKLINIECYDGLLDSNEHLGAFVTLMNLYTNDDIIMFRVLLTTLKRVALQADPTTKLQWCPLRFSRMNMISQGLHGKVLISFTLNQRLEPTCSYHLNDYGPKIWSLLGQPMQKKPPTTMDKLRAKVA